MHAFSKLRVAISILAGLVSLGAAADPVPPPQRILELAEAVRSPRIDYALDFTLRVRDPSTAWKERSAAYSLIAHGKDQSLVFLREPEAFHPGVLLIDHGLYWMLLPRSSKSFQLAPRHVLHGDVSNGDLARGNLLAQYRATLDGEDAQDGEACWMLDLEPTTRLALYSRIRCCIAKGTYRPLRYEYFGMTGALLKVARFRDYRDGELGVRPMRILVESRLRPGEQTEMVFSRLRPFPSDRLAFTREAMIVYRDTALERKTAGKPPLSPEDLLATTPDPSP